MSLPKTFTVNTVRFMIDKDIYKRYFVLADNTGAFKDVDDYTLDTDISREALFVSVNTFLDWLYDDANTDVESEANNVIEQSIEDIIEDDSADDNSAIDPHVIVSFADKYIIDAKKIFINRFSYINIIRDLLIDGRNNFGNEYSCMYSILQVLRHSLDDLLNIEWYTYAPMSGKVIEMRFYMGATCPFDFRCKRKVRAAKVKRLYDDGYNIGDEHVEDLAVRFNHRLPEQYNYMLYYIYRMHGGLIFPNKSCETYFNYCVDISDFLRERYTKKSEIKYNECLEYRGIYDNDDIDLIVDAN